MGCVVPFQIHCTSSTPSAGRPLPPPSRACLTPPQWCEPDPCIDLMTFHLFFHISIPDTHTAAFPDVITEVEENWGKEIYMFLPHPGDFTYCFLWRLNHKTVYFTSGHFAIFISNRSEESRGNDAEKRGRMVQKSNSCPQCEHRLQRLFTYYKYLHPLLIYFVFC